MNRKNSLKIIYWNAQGVSSKKNEMRAFIQERKPDILLLGETFLKPSHSLNEQNYITYRSDRSTREGGGTAALIRKDLKHTQIDKPNLQEIEISGVQVQTRRGPINIYSAYLSPAKPLLKEDISSIFDTNTPTILAGDLNSKHEEWNSVTRNHKGTTLKRIAEELNLQITGPVEHTHIHAQTNATDVLDIAISKNICQQIMVKTIHDIHSDHLPIEVSVDIQTEWKTLETKVTDWDTFKNVLTIRPVTIRNVQDINTATIKLQEDITKALAEATTTKIRNPDKPLPDHLRLKIAEKRIACREYKRTLHPEAKKRLNNLTNELKEDLKLHYNQLWDLKLEKLTSEDLSLWQVTKTLTKDKNRSTIPPLKSPKGTVTNDKEKAEIFAKYLEEAFIANESHKEHTKFHDEITRYNKTYMDNPAHHLQPTTVEEIETAIKLTRTKKAPGLDNITNQTLKKLPKEGIIATQNIVNAILEYKHFPPEWKQALIVMIHKQGKPTNEVSGYRPISLLPAISKIAEKTIYTRLEKQVEDLNMIPDFQYGFRKEHGPTQQVIRLTEHINNHLNTATPTSAIFLDVEKAFDKVWHEGLLYKMRQSGINDGMTRLIQSYLENRKFQTKIDDHISTQKTALAGVPQGSILGPLLYNIYSHDLPKPRLCSVAQYADDTVIYYSSRVTGHSEKILQEGTSAIVNWFRKWKININAKKTQAVYFRNRKRRKKPDCVEINNQVIPWKNTAKYLGVELDALMTFKQHTAELNKKIGRITNNLYPLLNSRSKLTKDNKIKLVKSIIIPTATYAGEIWLQAADNTKLKVQQKINKILRMATDSPFYITNRQIQNETGVAPLQQIIEIQTLRTLEKLQAHTNPTARKIFQPLRRTIKKEGINAIKRQAEEHGTTIPPKKRRT